jgi:hypothetical protein
MSTVTGTPVVTSVIPSTMIAGDTYFWTFSLPEYPSPTYVLTMVGWNAENRFSASGTYSGGDWTIALSVVDSAAIIPGDYEWRIHAEDGPHRHTLYRGRITVQPNYEGNRPFDTRTHARKVLDAIEAVIEGRATKDQEEYSIEGRSLKRTPLADLVKFRSQYQLELQREERAERAAAGLGSGRTIGVRFGRA